MTEQQGEGSNPQAQKAAEEWRRRLGREGHEGSYALHEDESGKAAQPVAGKAKPSRT